MEHINPEKPALVTPIKSLSSLMFGWAKTNFSRIIPLYALDSLNNDSQVNPVKCTQVCNCVVIIDL